MLRKIALGALAVAVIGAAPLGAQTADGPQIGEAAPTFSLPDTYGQTHDLAQYRGQWVVLEWLNYGCPYVVKHYHRSGNIPAQQEKWGERGVVWLAIVSSAPGTQGYYEPAEMNAESEKAGSKAAAVLLDPEGTVGRAYEARTTPQMVVIDPEGRVVYMGAIDSIASTRVEDIETAVQYVDQALTEAMAGQPVSVPLSRPYGCSVKYAQ